MRDPYEMKGDGLPNCPHCKGRGARDVPVDPNKKIFTPATMRCQCVGKRDLLLNLRRGWRGLERAKSIESPLVEYTKSNLRLTATHKTLQGHLRYVALRQPSSWMFQVSSDADLMSSWLAPAVSQGNDIIDPDVDQRPGQFSTLEGLIDPPELLVLILGIKSARNAAMPEVLLETLRHREFADKPTWLVDRPAVPFKLGHIAYSPGVEEIIGDWDGFDLIGEDEIGDDEFDEEHVTPMLGGEE